MAEEPTTQNEARQELNVPPQPPPEQTVPYDRFKQVNDQATEAKSELKKLQDRLQELEDQGKSETDRERSQRERAEQRATELQAELAQRDERLTRVERGQWVRAAAQEAKFIDPEDAVVNVDLSGVESERDAKKQVEKLAERKKHLVQQEQGRPEIGRVLQGGRPADPNAQVDEQAAQKQEGEAFVEELRAKLSEGSTSVPGLLDR